MITPTLEFETELWNLGYSYICGLDEVGRGSFAGPVVVGAVIFPQGCILIDGITDSKLLNVRQRERLAKVIKKSALAWSVAEIKVSMINKVGIGKATQMAFRQAVKSLSKKANFVLIDAFYIKHFIKHFKRANQKAIIKGDQKCFSISAASIIAKVHRDKLMKNFGKVYPQYGFGKHKGYGTKLHQEAIRKYGLSRIHRTSFNLQKFL